MKVVEEKQCKTPAPLYFTLFLPNDGHLPGCQTKDLFSGHLTTLIKKSYRGTRVSVHVYFMSLLFWAYPIFETKQKPSSHRQPSFSKGRWRNILSLAGQKDGAKRNNQWTNGKQTRQTTYKNTVTPRFL